jgi:hypothetical protein
VEVSAGLIVTYVMQDEGDGNTHSYDRSFTWYDKAPSTGNAVITLFGQLHIALDDLVTENAVCFCAGKEVAYAEEKNERQTQV